MAKFKDHFSAQSDGYRKFRPSYPPALYETLAGLCDEHDLAWDCATGNGQAARGLAHYFERVIATDASAQQIANASGPKKISYHMAKAENSGLKASHVDLITVAQALHWFDHSAFFAEAARVLKPGGILAVWTYNLLEADGEISAVIRRLSDDIAGDYWPAERQLVRDNYRTINFPFDAIKMPDFHMRAEWSLEDLLGYLGTWSSVMRYRRDRGRDPVELIRPELTALWGNGCKSMKWPLTLRVQRHHG